MSRFLVKRIGASAVVLAFVGIISFCIMSLVPGDPAAAIAGLGASADEIESIRQQFGLNEPFVVRMTSWMLGIASGDFGQSITLGRPVLTAILERLPATIGLTALAMVWTMVIGVGSGVVAALNHNTWIDRTLMSFTLLGVSLPGFWLGLMLIIVFSVQLDWFPTGGFVPLSKDPVAWFRSLFLPSIALGLLQIGLIGRITYSAMLEVLRQDYVRTARAKGLPPISVYGKHTLRNATLPIVTVLGSIISVMLSGAVVTETVFSIPGLGRLTASAITSRDYPVIQGALLFTAIVFVTINLITDLLYAWLDPRIRFT